jgi:hypothetical protein
MAAMQAMKLKRDVVFAEIKKLGAHDWAAPDPETPPPGKQSIPPKCIPKPELRNEENS